MRNFAPIYDCNRIYTVTGLCPLRRIEALCAVDSQLRLLCGRTQGARAGYGRYGAGFGDAVFRGAPAAPLPR